MPAFGRQVPDLRQTGPILEMQIAIRAALQATLQASGTVIPAPIDVTAIIDTGASISVMQRGFGARLGLRPTGTIHVHTASMTSVPCAQYAVRLLFPEHIEIATTVIEMPLDDQHVGLLIGRDILAHAVFVYVGSSNAFTLSI